MEAQVNSLKRLKVRQKELKIKKELCKRAFSHSLGTTRTELNSFLLKSVALPIGAVSLGAIGLKKLVFDDDENTGGSENYASTEGRVKKVEEKTTFNSILTALMPIITSAVQTYFLKK